MSKKFQPTAEQLALAEDRRLKKEQRKQAAAKEEEEKGRILPREWTSVQGASGPENAGQKVRLMTWNLLAQCLVRRELFPTSDCLKASQREHMMYREVFSHDADICCLQEVDRLGKLLPALEQAGYAHVYAAGPRKKHGCLIAYRTSAYTLVEHKMMEYDLQDVRENGTEAARRGSSFRTKNIASMARLKRIHAASEGVIVATTHLFWHPKYTYERARQAAILLREVVRFRNEGPDEHRAWPCIIAGDFNFQPDDPAYSLMVGDPLLPIQEQMMETSRVVHVTIDPDVPATSDKKPSAEEEDGAEVGAADPDRVITNARTAVPSDGLLTNSELAKIFRQSGTPTSVYDEAQRLVSTATSETGLTFGSRVSIVPPRRGAFEPIWTSYTHYWKSVLDYVFILSPPGRTAIITTYAKPHAAEALSPGIPRKSVCGSDHISLGAELYWPPR